MNENLVKCRVCGTTNRLPPPTPGRRPICGKCKSPLAVRGPVHVTDSTFGDHVERSPLPVLVDLWAEWCGPCHMIAPTVDQLASEMDGRLTVAKINIDENPETANRFGVRSIPTLLVFKNGQEVDRLIGVQPKEEIIRRLSKVLSP